MSKSTIKKLLQSMTKAEIIEMVLELYSARKEAKEYLEFYACPDEKGKLEEYKSIISAVLPKKNAAAGYTISMRNISITCSCVASLGLPG